MGLKCKNTYVGNSVRFYAKVQNLHRWGMGWSLGACSWENISACNQDLFEAVLFF